MKGTEKQGVGFREILFEDIARELWVGMDFDGTYLGISADGLDVQVRLTRTEAAGFALAIFEIINRKDES